MRLIDADALKENTTKFADCDGFNEVHSIIDNAPTVEQPKINRLVSDYDEAYCDRCNHIEVCKYYPLYGCVFRDEAKMKGEE